MRSFVDHSNCDSSSDRQRSWLGEDSKIYASKKHTILLKHPDYKDLWLHTSIFCRPLLFRRKFYFSVEKPLGDRVVRFVMFRIKSEFFSRNWLRAGLGSGLSLFLDNINGLWNAMWPKRNARNVSAFFSVVFSVQLAKTVRPLTVVGFLDKVSWLFKIRFRSWIL